MPHRRQSVMTSVMPSHRRQSSSDSTLSHAIVFRRLKKAGADPADIVTIGPYQPNIYVEGR